MSVGRGKGGLNCWSVYAITEIPRNVTNEGVREGRIKSTTAVSLSLIGLLLDRNPMAMFH